MKNYAIVAAGLLAFAALPAVAGPISFPECPAVGLNTTGCELLITVTAATGIPGLGPVATAFTVTTSSPDLGPFDGSDDTLIGVLNMTSGILDRVFFAVNQVPFTILTASFDGDGACKGAGSPLSSIYSPGPTAAQCLGGQYWTTDAMDYASAGLTFPSNGSIFVGNLASGASTWFSLPGAITASQITVASPTPEPASLVLLGTGLIALYFRRRRRA